MIRELRWLAAVAALLGTLAVSGCQRTGSSLDEIQRMAYGVRPAVVRVRAYATADFHPNRQSLQSIHDHMVRRDLAQPEEPAGTEGPVETGAGGSGSGFIVHPDGVILTSGHVVGLIRDPAAVQAELLRNGAVTTLLSRYPIDSLRTLHRSDALMPLVEQLASEGSLSDIRTFREIDLSNGDRAPFSILEYSPSLAQRGDDVAILRIERHDLPIIPLGNSEAVHVQDPIWAVGYPSVASSSDDLIGGWLSQESDLEPTVNSGSITAIKRNVANVPVFQTDVPIYRGNSGGPAVNRRGEVIGLATWGHAMADAIKFLVPSNVARAHLEKRRIDLTEEGSFTPLYRSALVAASEGRWSASLRALRKANALFPGNPDLARLTRDAEAAVRATPLWARPASIATAVAGAVVVALALAGLWVRRRRARPAVPHEPLSPTSSTIIVPLRDAADPQTLGKLTFLNGSRAGERLGLGGSGIRIGREQSVCEIVLEDPRVSRLHAEIVRLDGKVLLIDRNSSNGTWVNDRKIDRRILEDGDIIYFGGRNATAVAFHD